MLSLPFFHMYIRCACWFLASRLSGYGYTTLDIRYISNITLHYKTIYSGLSKSNFKDHYGDVVITQCLGKIAEINEFSASDEML